MSHPSIVSYVSNADFFVQSVMMLLLAASVVSWTFIVERRSFLRYLSRKADKFQKKFWSGTDMSSLFAEINHQKKVASGLEKIFQAGFKEFIRLRQLRAPVDDLMKATERAMRIELQKTIARMENHLSLLATIGSTSPYIGLLGTVWGIMTSFHALGDVSQASIAMVAPGISEALVATAMGLFAAIPAVIAYNRFTTRCDQLMNQFDTFQDELLGILYRQAMAQENG